jgi:hypothetical protein
MGQTARRDNFESMRSGSGPHSPLGSIRAERKLFLSPEASQAIEKVDSARENPRKSKSFGRCSKAHSGTTPRFGRDIQMPDSLLGRVAVIFSAFAPCNPLKTNNRRRFAAENGGKRRLFMRGFRASGHPKAPGRRPSGGAKAAGPDVQLNDDGLLAISYPVEPATKPIPFTFKAKSGCARCVHLLWSSPQYEDKR